MAQKLVRYIELEEFERVLKEEKDKKFKLAYVLGFGSGLRISEIVGYKDIYKPLTKENINLDKHQIRIFGKGEKERVTVTSPWLNKTNIELLPLDIPRRTLQGRFTRLSKKTLGRSLSFHTLRHGFGNYMHNVKNVPLAVVQTLLGHSRIDTTGVYTKANPVNAVERAWESF
jgi:site-specific recombinase XerC